MAEEKMHKVPLYKVPLGDIKDVKESGLNVRHRDIDVGVENLAKSIQKHGQLQPIILRGTPGKPPYDLIIGQRRLRAHQKLDKRFINAQFRGPRYGDFEANVESLAENLQRVKLNHADAAEAIAEIYKHYNKSVR